MGCTRSVTSPQFTLLSKSLKGQRYSSCWQPTAVSIELGTGAIDNRENDLFIGIVQEPLFQRLISHLSDDSLKYMGTYDIPDKVGIPCTLSIGLTFDNADNSGFVFQYGSESRGQPQEIASFVTAAVRLTAPWFEEQKQGVASAQGSENSGNSPGP